MRLALFNARLNHTPNVRCITFSLSALMVLAGLSAQAATPAPTLSKPASTWSKPAPTWSKDVKALGNVAVGDNGDISFIGLDATLYHLDSSGNVLWSYKLGDIGRAQPVLTPEGDTIVAAYDDTLQALDRTGKKRWAVTLDGDLFATPALRSDGSLIAASSAGSVYAVSPAGQILWRYRAGVPIFSSPVVDTNGQIYFGTQGNTFVALSGSGQLLWSYPTGSTVFSSPAIDAQGNLYFGSGDKKVYSLSPTGTQRWTYLTDGFVNASPVVTSGNLVVVGSYDGKLYALTTDGQKVWDYTATGPIAAPAAELTGGTLLVGDLNGTLHALSGNGQPYWALKVGNKIDTSVNVSPQGTVYVQTGGGKVSSFTALAPLADGPWSFYRQVAAGYGRPLSTQERRSIQALKQAAAQKALANLPKQITPAVPVAVQPSVQQQPTQATPPPVAPLASLARNEKGLVVWPLAAVIGSLGGHTPQLLPGVARFQLGQQQATLPLTWLSTASGDKAPWVSLKDLGSLNTGGKTVQASYTPTSAGAGEYRLTLDGKPLFSTVLELPALLKPVANPEFPGVIDY